MRVGWSTMAIFVDLAGHVFENFRDTASNTICNPLSACSSLQSERPWMTLRAILCQNPFSASISWIRAFECEKIIHPLRFCRMLYIEPLSVNAWLSTSQLASLGVCVQLTRCFSAVAELLVLSTYVHYECSPPTATGTHFPMKCTYPTGFGTADFMLLWSLITMFLF